MHPTLVLFSSTHTRQRSEIGKRRGINLLEHILASSETLSSVTLASVSLNWNIPDDTIFPHLAIFTLVDPLCRFSEARPRNAEKSFQSSSHLKNLTIRHEYGKLRLLPPRTVTPRFPDLVSLTVHSVLDDDDLLYSLKRFENLGKFQPS
ncbi:hypothetical protein M422DRAFT_30818 [Sphaerobolus stellatus SS14]|uniref:Uncharacterized protein n=1 Tax=Sphaerobolus stellatus (strain SS14) TaxID=990650 RepID=A0A0C9VYJ5_SPHS4|nr:hypothetical protein M422DRAFT_30818 [Sphaerobolus stellatus SS14]